MTKFKKKRFDEINVIPFIDIMLVLLVMVLTTATFVNQGLIPIDLPTASSKESVQKSEDEVDLYIDASGKIFLSKEELSLSELKRRLSGVKKEQNIILRSDKESRFQDFVSVMDLLKDLGLDQLYIVTQDE
ncbi:MAG: biopolymer transporter ExbD [Sulfuricurvum sp.]